MLVITHTLLISAIFLFIGTLIHSWVKCHERRVSTLFAAFLLLCAAGVIDLVRFYINPVDNDNSLFFKIGLLVFIAVLGLSSIRDSLRLFRDAVHVEVYKKLAYTDTTTKLANRTAYERDLENLRHSLPIESLTIVSFDLNNLKLTNDTLGHSMGDTLIIDSGTCIQSSFKETGNCYRIGGDEFCVIAKNLEHSVLKACLDAFDASILEYNEGHEPRLDIARGYSCGPVHTAGALDQLIRQADQAMYLCKEECHLSGR
nr:GGDEF domain-containing protein [Eubacterium sp. 1001713B170207_170306_E7]